MMVMKAMSKVKWKKLSKEEIEFIRIYSGSWLTVAERDSETLRIIYSKTMKDIPESPFIVGKYMYIVTRNIEKDDDFVNSIWTYRVYRIPVESVETMVIKRVKE